MQIKTFHRELRINFCKRPLKTSNLIISLAEMPISLCLMGCSAFYERSLRGLHHSCRENETLIPVKCVYRFQKEIKKHFRVITKFSKLEKEKGKRNKVQLIQLLHI